MRTTLQVIAFVFCVSLTPFTSAQEAVTEDFARLSSDRWTIHAPGPLSGFEVRDHELLIKNRLYCFLNAERQNATHEVEFTTEDTGGKRQYANSFLLVTRSKGDPREKSSYEIPNRLSVRVEFGNGKISLEHIYPGQETDSVIAHKFVRLRDGKLEVADTEFKDEDPALPEGAGVNWYSLKLDDDGKTAVVTFNGTEVIRKDFDVSKVPGKRCGFTIRELGPVQQVMYVKKFVSTPK